jgi:hypothetical protein
MVRYGLRKCRKVLLNRHAGHENLTHIIPIRRPSAGSCSSTGVSLTLKQLLDQRRFGPCSYCCSSAGIEAHEIAAIEVRLDQALRRYVVSEETTCRPLYMNELARFASTRLTHSARCVVRRQLRGAIYRGGTR